MTSLDVRRVINGGRIKLKLVPVGPKKLIGGGVVKLEQVRVLCPACGEQVEAVASEGQVKGYCAVAKQFVDFTIETQLVPQSVVRIDNLPTAETRARLSAASKKRWQGPEYRAKQIAGVKKRWQNPEYRAKQIATHTGKHPTAKHRAKISAALKRRHESERRVNERPG